MFLLVWVFTLLPIAVLWTDVRERKRRLTIRTCMIWVALIAADLAVVRSVSSVTPRFFTVWALHAMPFLFMALYIPRRWDRRIALLWVLTEIVAWIIIDFIR